jgi:hypothetical protein
MILILDYGANVSNKYVHMKIFLYLAKWSMQSLMDLRISSVTRNSAVTHAASRSSSVCKRNVAICRNDTANTLIRSRIFPPKPLRCDPAEDYPACPKQNYVGHSDSKLKLKHTLLP